MFYSAAPTGMRALAGDYRDADVRWAQARRSARPAKAAEATGRSVPTPDAVAPAFTTRFARLRALMPYAR